LSIRLARWLLFAVFALTVPAPLLGPYAAFAPAARYVILATATGVLAASEGAGGPVPLILALFVGHALVYLALAWLAAWLLSRLLGRLSAPIRSRVVFALCGGLLLISLAFDLYRTPFGTRPSANLFGVLS
jgi:hypothetical protein